MPLVMAESVSETLVQQKLHLNALFWLIVKEETSFLLMLMIKRNYLALFSSESIKTRNALFMEIVFGKWLTWKESTNKMSPRQIYLIKMIGTLPN